MPSDSIHPSPARPSASDTAARRTARSPVQRVAIWGLWLLGLLLAVLVVLAILVAVMDWNRAKPWVNAKVSEATGRHFAIEGDLSVAWRWPQPLEDGWQRWLPGVTVKADNLVMDNPDAFVPPFRRTDGKAAAGKAGPSTQEAEARTHMARIGSATATLSLWPLLGQHVAIDTVDLAGPDIAFARTADGSNNWTFKRKDGPSSGWSFDVDRLIVHQGVLAYADGMKDLDVRARLDTTAPELPKRRAAQGGPASSAKAASAKASAPARASSEAAAPSVAAASAPGSSAAGNTAVGSTEAVPYGLRFELEGRYMKAQIKGQGRAGQVISLRNKVVNYPLQIDASAGSVALSAEGILANPGALSGLDFQVLLKADSMADLYEVTGLVLPNTPPFETDGRLTGSLEPERAVWQYDNFDGKVGQSDLHGSLKYTSGKPRPRLTGTMTSNQLRLADLGPTIGTSKPDNTNRGRERVGKGKVLPDSKFAAERWNAMDMDIVFKGRHIIRPESLPLQDLSVHAVMENAQLKLAPLTFGVAEGKIESQVSIDGRAAPLKAQIRGTVQGLQLSALFPKVQLMKKSFGRMDGAIALESTGNSVAGLLGKGTGEMRLYVREGTLSKQMLDLAALNVGSIVVGKLFGDTKEVHLRCAVADFTVVEGLATTRVVKMSTDDAIIEATGTINLGTEELNLRIKPESLEWKFFSLRSPLYVKGTFGNPDVGVEAGPLLLRAGAAVVAAAVAPVALALIPVTVPAADDDTHCKPLLDLGKQPVKPGAQGAAGTASQPARQAASKAATAR
ncbi:AsmA family protein [Acidovorax sp. Leaf78]|uniref:AsmA family protein n=1 Tax=Acidovorax sp. Leaf78 TaxID=1736237 RepID=UPI0006FA8AB8|nr:AsmA family protein [Acidovorax sp. Leaf78]KQO20047.1 membrane assembly protein AsmA [Acidovorax sp. Leaf78]